MATEPNTTNIVAITLDAFFVQFNNCTGPLFCIQQHHHHQSELVGDVAVPVSARQAVPF